MTEPSDLFDYLTNPVFVLAHLSAPEHSVCPKVIIKPEEGKPSKEGLSISPEERVTRWEDAPDYLRDSLPEEHRPRIVVSSKMKTNTNSRGYLESDGEGSPAMKCRRFRLIWGEWADENTIHMNREGGPCVFTATQMIVNYTNMTFSLSPHSAVRVDTLTALWNKNGIYHRSTGPFRVYLEGIKIMATAEEDGLSLQPKRFQINPNTKPKTDLIWNTQRDRRIPEGEVARVLNDQDFDIAPLALDTVFGSPVDEMCFWGEIRE